MFITEKDFFDTGRQKQHTDCTDYSFFQESGAEIHMGPRTVDELLRDAANA